MDSSDEEIRTKKSFCPPSGGLEYVLALEVDRSLDMARTIFGACEEKVEGIVCEMTSKYRRNMAPRGNLNSLSK